MMKINHCILRVENNKLFADVWEEKKPDLFDASLSFSGSENEEENLEFLTSIWEKSKQTFLADERDMENIVKLSYHRYYNYQYHLTDQWAKDIKQGIQIDSTLIEVIDGRVFMKGSRPLLKVVPQAHIESATSSTSGVSFTAQHGIGHKSLLGSTSTSANINTYCDERVEVNELHDCIEMIYKRTSMIQNLGFNSKPDVQIYKIVFSCIDGKWYKSEPIFGKIIPAQDEYYEFE